MLFVRAASSSRRACDVKSEQIPFIAGEWLVRAGAVHMVARVAACAARHRPQPLLTHPAQLLFLRVCRSDGGIHKVQRARLLLFQRRCSSKLSPGNLAACICAPSHSHWHSGVTFISVGGRPLWFISASCNRTDFGSSSSPAQGLAAAAQPRKREAFVSLFSPNKKTS